MSYSWKTFLSSRNDLALRLGDTSKIHWTDTELGLLIIEALRTRSCLAQPYRDRCQFNTQDGISFYDLTSTTNPNPITGGTGPLPTNPPFFLGYSLTDRSLISDIVYHLLEPPITNFALPWAGTDQFSFSDIVDAIQDSRNAFIQSTSPHLTHSEIAIGIPPASGRVPLSDSIISVRRVAWKTFDPSSLYIPLHRDDEFTANAFSPGWNVTAGTPEAYSTLLSPRVALQLIPLAIDVGTLDLITTNIPSNLDHLTGVLLNTPDDYAWIIKWGALASLLSKDSQSYDAARSAYCLYRFNEGIRYVSISSTINQSFLDGIPTQPDSLLDWDTFSPNWQNTSVLPNEKLTSISILSRNLIAVSPVPDSLPHSVQLDVVRNCPIPILDSDFLQIGREEYESLIDYSLHLAMFKEAGGEFTDTFPLLNSFMQSTLTHNQMLKADAKNYNIMRDFSIKESLDRPMLEREERETAQEVS